MDGTQWKATDSSRLRLATDPLLGTLKSPVSCPSVEDVTGPPGQVRMDTVGRASMSYMMIAMFFNLVCYGGSDFDLSLRVQLTDRGVNYLGLVLHVYPLKLERCCCWCSCRR